MQIFVGFLRKRASNDNGVVDGSNFQRFRISVTISSEISDILCTGIRYAVPRRLFSYPKMRDLE